MKRGRETSSTSFSFSPALSRKRPRRSPSPPRPSLVALGGASMLTVDSLSRVSLEPSPGASAVEAATKVQRKSKGKGKGKARAKKGGKGKDKVEIRQPRLVDPRGPLQAAHSVYRPSLGVFSTLANATGIMNPPVNQCTVDYPSLATVVRTATTMGIESFDLTFVVDSNFKCGFHGMSGAGQSTCNEDATHNLADGSFACRAHAMDGDKLIKGTREVSASQAFTGVVIYGVNSLWTVELHARLKATHMTCTDSNKMSMSVSPSALQSMLSHVKAAMQADSSSMVIAITHDEMYVHAETPRVSFGVGGSLERIVEAVNLQEAEHSHKATLQPSMSSDDAILVDVNSLCKFTKHAKDKAARMTLAVYRLQQSKPTSNAMISIRSVSDSDRVVAVVVFPGDKHEMTEVLPTNTSMTSFGIFKVKSLSRTEVTDACALGAHCEVAKARLSMNDNTDKMKLVQDTIRGAADKSTLRSTTVSQGVFATDMVCDLASAMRATKIPTACIAIARETCLQWIHVSTRGGLFCSVRIAGCTHDGSGDEIKDVEFSSNHTTSSTASDAADAASCTPPRSSSLKANTEALAQTAMQIAAMSN